MSNPKSRIIIDTDPGVDDVLALLLAFAAKPEELEILLISVCYGNVDVQNCLRNVVTVFHIIEKEKKWRRKMEYDVGFEMLDIYKPLVAVGAEEPLADQMMIADFFHGVDGLSGVHTSHPHLTPEETWKTLFVSADSSDSISEVSAIQELRGSNSLFRASKQPAHKEILQILRENEPETITIVAIGPLTNLARAAAVDVETFLRVKEIVIMGGAVDTPGNVNLPIYSFQPERLKCLKDIQAPPFKLIKGYPSISRKLLNVRNQVTPTAEFNFHADSVAAARVFALTSKIPSSTMPQIPQRPDDKISASISCAFLGPYPPSVSKQLDLTLFPLDLTSEHELSEIDWEAASSPLSQAGSPLAEWLNAILSVTFKKIRLLQANSDNKLALALHDPLCIWYALNRSSLDWQAASGGHEDIRIESSGQWTRGMCVVDRRNRKRIENDGGAGNVSGDAGLWLREGSGNHVRRIVSGIGDIPFSKSLLSRILAR